MDSVLDALQEGRLVELPDNDKQRSLQVLAHLIEAIPSLAVGTDVAGLVWAREQASSTNLGMSWACPHAHISEEGDLLCAIGWSPKGIDYGPPGEAPVRMVVMYLVPENQKKRYLKEIAMLAKTVKSDTRYQNLDRLSDLSAARNLLLDLVSAAKDVVVPDARARMIQLETRVSAPSMVVPALSGMVIQPITVITGPGIRPVVLTQSRELLDVLDNDHKIAESLAQQGSYSMGSWHVVRRSTSFYEGDRVVFDCLAIRPS